MTTTVTLEQLEDLEACEKQREIFARLFPEGRVEVTVELCVRHASEFDWDWAVDALLTASARNAYHEAIASAWNAHREAIVSAEAAHREAIASAWNAYREAQAGSWARAFLSEANQVVAGV